MKRIKKYLVYEVMDAEKNRLGFVTVVADGESIPSLSAGRFARKIWGKKAEYVKSFLGFEA